MNRPNQACIGAWRAFWIVVFGVGSLGHIYLAIHPNHSRFDDITSHVLLAGIFSAALWHWVCQ